MPVQVEAAAVQVVAAHDMPMGTMITKDHVKLVPWPASSPVDGVSRPSRASSTAALIVAVAANEPLTETKLAPLERRRRPAAAIPPGMRAISVKVNEVIGVAGFVVPGTRVDVLVTLESRTQEGQHRPASSSATSRCSPPAPATTRRRRKDGQPIPTTVVTLLVTPEDAERIALAPTEGRSC